MTARRAFLLRLADDAGPGDAPAEVRLRQLLKSLLRRWGFRCLSVESVEEASAGLPPAGQGPEEGSHVDER